MQTNFGYPKSLTEKYQPASLSEFVGLEKPKAVFSKFVQAPYPSAWLFLGNSGVGKTTFALSLANALKAEVHHIGSQRATVAEIEAVVKTCWYAPHGGTFHIVICDEADRMSNAAQLLLLSKLDSTAAVPNTIWIFTCNSTEGFEPRFLSRTRQIAFQSHGMSEGIAELLARVWKSETDAPCPNLSKIVKESANNVRESLMRLETELLCA